MECRYQEPYFCINQTHFCNFLTVVNTFPYTFSEKYFLLFVIPPFHLCMVIIVIIKRLRVVELPVEYGWNYMKFHPYFHHNSTLSNTLNVRYIDYQRWKSGTSLTKNIFLRIIAEKL